MTAPGPLISVIIPCWNAASFVGEAIESALAQSYTPLEVVVVDDGSTDGSREIIQGFGDRVRYVEGAHAGGGVARNRGQRAARGDYWLFLDADDVLLPDAAAVLMEAVKASGAAAAYGNVIFADEKLNPIETRRYSPVPDAGSIKSLLLSGVPTTGSVLCSRHSSVTWSETLKSCQEFHYFAMRAIDGDEFVYVPVEMALIRQHDRPTRVSNQASTASVRSFAQVWQDIESQLRAKQMLDGETRALLNNAYLGVYLGCRRTGLRDLSRLLSAKIDRRQLRHHARFRWLSTAGVCVLTGVHLAAVANASVVRLASFRRKFGRMAG